MGVRHSKRFEDNECKSPLSSTSSVEKEEKKPVQVESRVSTVGRALRDLQQRLVDLVDRFVRQPLLAKSCEGQDAQQVVPDYPDESATECGTIQVEPSVADLAKSLRESMREARHLVEHLTVRCVLCPSPAAEDDDEVFILSEGPRKVAEKTRNNQNLNIENQKSEEKPKKITDELKITMVPRTSLGLADGLIWTSSVTIEETRKVVENVRTNQKSSTECEKPRRKTNEQLKTSADPWTSLGIADGLIWTSSIHVEESRKVVENTCTSHRSDNESQKPERKRIKDLISLFDTRTSKDIGKGSVWTACPSVANRPEGPKSTDIERTSTLETFSRAECKKEKMDAIVKRRTPLDIAEVRTFPKFECETIVEEDEESEQEKEPSLHDGSRCPSAGSDLVFDSGCSLDLDDIVFVDLEDDPEFEEMLQAEIKAKFDRITTATDETSKK